MALPIDKSYLLTQLRNFKSVILDPAYIIQKTTLPTANASNEGKIFQYIGTDSTNYTIGGFYQCQEVTPATDPVTYTWTEVSTKTLIDDETIKRNTTTKELYVPKATASTLGAVKPGDGLAVDTAGSLRVVARLEEISELPTATAALEGKCYILVADQTGYSIGNVYQCQSDGATTPTYSWVTINKGFDDNFVGTLAQWNALSLAEQIKYKTADITDDFNGSPVDDALSDTSSNPVQNKVITEEFGSIGNIRLGNAEGGETVIIVPNNTVTVTYSVKLPEGVWLAIGSIDWAANTSGYRQIQFVSSGGINPSRDSAVTSVPSSLATKEHFMQMVKLFELQSTATISLYALQTSGGDLNAYPQLRAIRIR